MEDLKTILILKHIDALIRKQATGTPEELGEKVNRKPSSVHRFIRILKSWGAPIRYSRTLRSYVYTEPCKFIVGYILQT